MGDAVDCIVPFYNEGARVVAVLEALVRVGSISRIICVDDGSTDNAFRHIKKQFPRVTLVRHKKNLGKASAWFSGLEYVRTESLLVIDADLVNVIPKELDAAIQAYFGSSIDMLILKATGRRQYKFFEYVFRNYIIQSGIRIIKKSDLDEIEKLQPRGYQIEVAINQYMMDMGKRVCWLPISAVNPHKSEKYPFFEGWKRDFQMEIEIMKYRGFIKAVLQILYFCRKKYNPMVESEQ